MKMKVASVLLVLMLAGCTTIQARLVCSDTRTGGETYRSEVFKEYDNHRRGPFQIVHHMWIRGTNSRWEYRQGAYESCQREF